MLKAGKGLLAVIMLVFVAGHAHAARIILKNGYELNADVLKSDDAFIVVDIGCEVLRLPRSHVVDVVEEAELPVQDGAAAMVSAESGAAAGSLYRQRKINTKTTIEKNTEQFSEAVVMVSGPGGQGSGFIISPDGYLITNFHVVEQETLIKVTVFRKNETGYDQKHYKKVKIIALNPYVDLALLKIEETQDVFNPVYLGEIDRVEVGETVFAIGNPLGLTRTVSQGIVSTKNRNFDGRLYIQTTTDINPGNSGGPLFNLNGEVIGVTSMGYAYLGGLNFAIPVNAVTNFIDNRDAFAYDEDNPNNGFRYLQPSGRINVTEKSPCRLPDILQDGQK